MAARRTGRSLVLDLPIHMRARLRRAPVRLPDATGARVGILVGTVLAVWLLAARILPNGAPPGVVLIGAILGSASALTAVGLVLVWKSARIVNFAIGAMGAATGLTCIRLHTAWGWPYPVALVIGVAAGVVVGVGVDALVMRRFTNAPRLIASVATLGLAQLLGGIELLLPNAFFRDDPGVVTIGGFETPLSALKVPVGAHVIDGNHLLILAAVPMIVAGLVAFLRRSLTGTAIRGAAENREWARLLGIRVSRLSLCSWGVVGGLAAATYLLRAPFMGTVPSAAAGAASLILPLAAALIAGMESLSIACTAAVLLGAADQVVRWNFPRTPALADVMVFVVILVVLLVRRANTSRAQDRENAMQILPTPRLGGQRRSPRVTAGLSVGAVIVAIVAALSLPQLIGDSTAFTLSIAGVWGLVAISTVVATGWTGQLSLGQFAIVGVSAVVAGNLIGGDHQIDLFRATAAAVVTGMIVAAVIGIPAMRIRGPFLGIATLAFAIVVDAYLLNPNYFPDLLPQDVKRPVLLGRWPLEDEQAMLSLTLIFLIGALVIAASVRSTRSGRHLLAARDNPKGLEAFGASSKAAALKGFVLSGAIAGLAGALHVMILHGVRLGTYQPGASVESFSSTTIGGLASLWGSVAATFGLRAGEDALTPELRLVTMGLGVLLVLWLFPAGLAGVPNAVRSWVARRRPASMDTGDEVLDLDLLTEPDDSVDSVIDHEPVAVPRLASRGLEVSFGRLQVLFGIDLDVADGELLALLGTNGAGKSTWMRAVMGLTPSSGPVLLGGDDISGRPTEELVRQGIALMMGGRSTFPTLTVDEHLRLAGWIRRHDHDAIDRERAEVLALFPSLVARAAVSAGDLSGGEQQQLALAQTLMLRPRVLLVDELSLGLSPLIVSELMAVLRRLHDDGITIIVVEQSVNVAMSVAQRAVFLEKGRVRFDGPTAVLLERHDLVRSIFFDAPDAPDAPDASRAVAGNGNGNGSGSGEADAAAATVLACTDVRKRFGGVVAVDDVSLAVLAGEIVGLIGQNGAGKSTLLDCLSGFTALDGGRISLRGNDVDGWAPWERARAGLGRTFQEARLFPALTVAETVAVARERHLTNRSMVADAMRQPRSWESERDIAADVEALLADCGLESHRDALTSVLSTGTRRIVELACQLATEPTVLLLDEPSAGVAQREAEALASRLLDLRDRTGAAMVIVEHDMGLLRSVCDRLVALELGAVIAEGRPEDVIADPRVIASYLGTDEVAIGRSDRRPLLATVQP